MVSFERRRNKRGAIVVSESDVVAEVSVSELSSVPVSVSEPLEDSRLAVISELLVLSGTSKRTCCGVGVRRIW